MAATMASLGGLDIVHSNLFAADQASVVRSVESRHVPILSAPTFRAPSDSIHSLDDFESCPYMLVTQSNSASSQLLDKRSSRFDWFEEVEEFGCLFGEKLEGKIVFLHLTKKPKQYFTQTVTTPTRLPNEAGNNLLIGRKGFHMRIFHSI
ncbi:hypothetical protein FH972_005199 [Carpinus fangiana]|uniref:Uncharacterized protein n=1 Tax=Carpinus fangiana TaxID=176857 RepID=A0A5N6QQX4_9ROSI|nr:hypothetical protein FH972_005199 [Carpinus fangiana]